MGNSAAYHFRAAQQVVVQNTGEPCTLRGSLTLYLDDEASDTVSADSRKTLLDAGQEAYFTLGAPGYCPQSRGYDQDLHVTRADYVWKGAKQSRGHLDGLALDAVCGDFSLDAPVPIVVDDAPPQALEVGVTAPHEVTAGSSMSYDVTLQNVSKAPYMFGDTCPVFGEIFNESQDIVESSFVLPCEPGSTIAAGESRAFSFEAAVPAQYGRGGAKFGWYVDGGATGGTVVQVR